MAVQENLVIMGQDIAEYGGAFKVTEGLVDLFENHGFAIPRFVKAW
ncbi:hypothetical protein LWM68_42935 [Niabella sp. W65]|nr:hypothetical protein [Niabella sp. W65]MCH7368899.1 hypothetical protein [Niabella sp. W65]ULT44469.1 hypothetical protein KRR40_14635 [Niabella sp. I65]